jgi:hypothetical protein
LKAIIDYLTFFTVVTITTATQKCNKKIWCYFVYIGSYIRVLNKKKQGTVFYVVALCIAASLFVYILVYSSLRQ